MMSPIRRVALLDIMELTLLDVAHKNAVLAPEKSIWSNPCSAES